MWFPNRSDTDRAVHAQKQARSLKFWIYSEEELYDPCSENKGADQLRGNREADLRLCFRICRLLVFPCGGSFLCLILNEKVTVDLFSYKANKNKNKKKTNNMNKQAKNC